MPHVALLTYYCVFILLASIAGGMIPVWFRLTHRGMEFAVSFVAGLMLGVGLLHMLPHAIADAIARRRRQRGSGRGDHDVVDARRLPGDVLHRAILLLPPSRRARRRSRPYARSCRLRPSITTTINAHHDVTWSGAALGLFLHSLLNGVALAASVANSHGDTRARRPRHVPRDLPPQAVRRDDDRHADGPRRLVARLAAHGQRPVLAGDSARRVGLLLRSDVGDRRHIEQPHRRLCPGLLGRHVSVHLVERPACRNCNSISTTAASCRRRCCLGLAVAIAVAALEEAAHGPHSHAAPPAAADP